MSIFYLKSKVLYIINLKRNSLKSNLWHCKAFLPSCLKEPFRLALAVHEVLLHLGFILVLSISVLSLL